MHREEKPAGIVWYDYGETSCLRRTGTQVECLYHMCRYDVNVRYYKEKPECRQRVAWISQSINLPEWGLKRILDMCEKGCAASKIVWKEVLLVAAY